MRNTFAASVVIAVAMSSPALADVQGAASGVAEPSAAGDPQQTYGTASLTAAVVGAYECDPFDPAQQISPIVGSPNRFSAGFILCPLTVPAGATLVSIELEACDPSTTAQASMQLIRTTSPGGSGGTVATVATGAAAAPGCDRFAVAVPGAPQVDNAAQKWVLQVQTGTGTYFGAGRVLYRLNVSPAPATATFSDVPVGNGQHRFVEALVAAGITGGCGGGQYCPDAAVTRGQMAVFLSVALGLHFAP